MGKEKMMVKSFDELTKKELYDALFLRAKVFVVEQECAYLDLDYLDQKCLHCLLYDKAELVAYARVIPAGLQHEDVGIGRVVTSRQGQGYGYRIFAEAMKAAKEKLGARRIEIASQAYIQNFYRQFGFRAASEEYILEFRPHLTMIWEAPESENDPTSNS